MDILSLTAQSEYSNLSVCQVCAVLVCVTVLLPSRYNIEFSRHWDTSSLKFILKLLMFDHSLRNFVLKFAELRDLHDTAEEDKK